MSNALNLDVGHSMQGSFASNKVPNDGGRRLRASTASATMSGRRQRASSDVRPGEAIGSRLQRHDDGSFLRPSASRRTSEMERTPLLSGPRSPGARSSRSISITSKGEVSIDGHVFPTDGASPDSAETSRPSSWRNMLRKESQQGAIPGMTPQTQLRVIQTPEGEAIVVTKRRQRHWAIRYWRPLASGAHWKALFHLVLLNFPFMVVLWPILVAGTLSGTILLITLPLGVLIWFLLLLISRSACRLELAMQLTFHGPLRSDVSRPVYFPIYMRIKPTEESAVLDDRVEVVWDYHFFRNAWSMFSDPISYQCLSYLVTTKAVITLVSTLIMVIAIPISVALIIPLPYALELVRRFGRWQAGLAVEALQ